jgi:hypothetical protein
LAHRLRPVTLGVLCTGAALGAAAACSDARRESPLGAEADASVYDAATVAPLDGSAPLDGGRVAVDEPSCERYCNDVLTTCTGEDAQYASPEECVRLCAKLPPGALGDKAVGTLACRAYHASTTARTDPRTWCAAAGPFGGNVCGDRCADFCDLAFAVCSGASGTSALPWTDIPDCVTACAGFAYLDGGIDGGGDGTTGKPSGDTLNCRQRALREALVDSSWCADLGADGKRCR